MSVMRTRIAAGGGVAVAACAALGGLAACDGAACGPEQATVERVIDGDTIVVTGGVRVRYLLVDAPETASGGSECYGANAAQFNADLVLGRRVELDHDAACQDRFGRTLAYVRVDGRDVGRLLIERGYACVLHIPPDGDAQVGEFRALEAAARAAGRGLWGACDPVPCQRAATGI